jgi:predicted Holliday junction resolvase-like endonuclease
MEKAYLILGIIGGAIIGYFIWKLIKYQEIKQHRKQAVKQSRAVILGEVAEKIAPILPQIPYNPKDMVFIWKAVDYVVFDWLAWWKLKQIIFLEIKSWKSKQNSNEKQVEQIIKLKKVKYQVKTL